jgi:dihydroorotase
VFIRGGTVVDADGTRRADVTVDGGRIAAVGPDLDVPAGATVLEAGGCLVAPGLVDLHAHLRQPGREEAETVETGTRAAALGGYTAVVAMPNTEPPIDDAGIARDVLELGRATPAEVSVAGAITVGRAGERLAPLAELAALGVRLFTDDGAGVQDGALMRRALDYARGLGVTLAQHCEDERLAAGGAMHEGEWSSRLGVPGQPAAAEEAMVARDIALVRLTSAPVHFLHLSTAGSVELVRRARAEGLPVTAEAAPHHFSLTDAEVAGYDPVFRVNPPLRTPADVAAVQAGLADGTIDAIATDHAPHAPEAKELPFDLAPPGMIGLETALAVAFTSLHRAGEGIDRVDGVAARVGNGPPGAGGGADRGGNGVGLSAERIFALASWQPAAIARLGPDDLRPGGHSAHGGPVSPGSCANLCVFDPAARWASTRAAWPAAAATRPTPAAPSSAGYATPCCGASRS